MITIKVPVHPADANAVQFSGLRLSDAGDDYQETDEQGTWPLIDSYGINKRPARTSGRPDPGDPAALEGSELSLMSTDNRAGQIPRVVSREVSGGRAGERSHSQSARFGERGSGLSERLWRATGPPLEGSVERRRFGVLQKERDVADAQAAILKQGACEITSHLIENMTE